MCVTLTFYTFSMINELDLRSWGTVVGLVGFVSSSNIFVTVSIYALLEICCLSVFYGRNKFLMEEQVGSTVGDHRG